jgi:hypothetical protein
MYYMGTQVATLGSSLNTQDVHSERLHTKSATYSKRCFRQMHRNNEPHLLIDIRLRLLRYSFLFMRTFALWTNSVVRTNRRKVFVKQVSNIQSLIIKSFEATDLICCWSAVAQGSKTNKYNSNFI